MILGNGITVSGGMTFEVFVVPPLQGYYLWTWGDNFYGRLGQNSTPFFINDRSSPTQVGLDTNWLQASGGSRASIAVKTNGTLWSWGYNSSGQLGLGDAGSYTSHSSPVQVGLDTNWATACMGADTSFAIRNTGTLWAWGDNFYGQLGLGDTILRSSPVQVGTDSDWAQVTAGSQSSLAVTTTGSLWAWGNNSFGQLGLGDRINRSSPVQVGLDTDWLLISAGFSSTFAVKTNNTLWAWGANYDGQLGLGNSGSYTDCSSPVQIGTDTNWASISTASGTAVAVRTNGTLWVWGSNDTGQLGLGNRINRSSPTQVGTGITWSKASVIAASGSVASIDAVKTDGTLWAWGQNGQGQLGLGDVDINRSSPVQVGTDTTWSTPAVGALVSLVIKSTGTLWAWGYNKSGQLGTNTAFVITSQSSPTQVGTDADWISQSINVSSAAIKTNNTLWSWGYNYRGQLGLGDLIDRSSPVQVGTDTDWAAITSGDKSTAAIRTDGTLWAWGYNYQGQLGLGDKFNNRSSPVQVGLDTDWLQISVGSFHAIATRTNNTLWSWGYNIVGELGLGDADYSTARSSPTQVGTDANWLKILGSDGVSFAIKTDGTLWSWGYNNQGELGLGDYESRSSPVQVGLDTTWASITAGSGFSLAIRTNSTLWAWGYNGQGQLGLGDRINRSSPVQVGLDTDWLLISAGFSSTFAVKTNNTLWAWGSNDQGQLGLGNSGSYTNCSSPVQVGTNANWHGIATKRDGSGALRSAP